MFTETMEHENMSDSVITVSEFCSALRISRTTAWRLLSSGEIKSVRLGRRSIRVLSQSVSEYLARNVTEVVPGITRKASERGRR